MNVKVAFSYLSVPRIYPRESCFSCPRTLNRSPPPPYVRKPRGKLAIARTGRRPVKRRLTKLLLLRALKTAFGMRFCLCHSLGEISFMPVLQSDYRRRSRTRAHLGGEPQFPSTSYTDAGCPTPTPTPPPPPPSSRPPTGRPDKVLF